MTEVKFPTDHEYLCGNGVRVDLDNLNFLSMFEDESHNCIDIKGFINGEHFWEQFFYWDYEPDDMIQQLYEDEIDYSQIRKQCQKDAEKKFMELKILMEDNYKSKLNINPNQILIDFMWKKQEVLAELTKTRVPEDLNYFNETDAEEILNWDETCAKNILETIKNAMSNYISIMNDSTICPFCIYYSDNCSRCAYGLEHGVCNLEAFNPDSYMCILDQLSKFSKFCSISEVVRQNESEFFKILKQ